MMKLNRYLAIFSVSIAVLLLSGCGGDSSSTGPDPDPPVNEQIDWNAAANTSTEALISNFWNNSGYYWNGTSLNQQFSYWPGAHATDVIIDAYLRTDDPTYKTYIDDWYTGVMQKMNGTFINDYYDDMEWNALALLRAYNATGEQKFKDSIDNLWTDIKGGWSDDVAGGGIIWTKSNPNGKNAISNAPASILASRLYKLTDDQEYLAWAEKIFDWEKNTLVNASTGAVWDNVQVQPDGSEVIKKDWIFTYNEGVYLGAALELYQITGDKFYLNEAKKAADYTLNSLSTSNDRLLKDEGGGDGGLFKGIFVRYFTQLMLEDDLAESTRTRYLQFLEHNAKTLYEEGTSPNTLYSSYWKVEPNSGDQVDLTVELSGSMLIEAAALLDNHGLFTN